MADHDPTATLHALPDPLDNAFPSHVVILDVELQQLARGASALRAIASLLAADQAHQELDDDGVPTPRLDPTQRSGLIDACALVGDAITDIVEPQHRSSARRMLDPALARAALRAADKTTRAA
jgi:hypothetical protein